MLRRQHFNRDLNHAKEQALENGEKWRIKFQIKRTICSKNSERQSGSGKVKEGEEVRDLVIFQMIQVLLIDGKEFGFSSECDGDQSSEAVRRQRDLICT